MSRLTAVSVLLLALAVTSCGGEAEFPPGHTPAPVVLVTAAAVPSAGAPRLVETATPHPTFTPFPTLTPVPVRPTRAVTESLTFSASDYTRAMPLGPAPTAVLDGAESTPDSGMSPRAPTESVPDDPGAEMVPTATPAPHGFIPGPSVSDGAFPLYHTFFPTVTPELPEILEVISSLDELPERYRYVTQSARALHWFVFYDVSRMPDSWNAAVYVRWFSLRGDVEHLMIEQPYVMSGAGNLAVIRSSVGESSEVLWLPGGYSVRLMDAELSEIIRWDFDVR